VGVVEAVRMLPRTNTPALPILLEQSRKLIRTANQLQEEARRLCEKARALLRARAR
jgi:hypothetical protein